jgi:hypothetical protein
MLMCLSTSQDVDSIMRHGEQKIAQFRTHDLTKGLMRQIGLTFEYSRMQVPSLSRGCEIDPSDERFRMRFRSTFQGCEYWIWATKR